MHGTEHHRASKRVVGIVAVLLVAFGLVARMAGPAAALPDTAPPELHGGTLAEPSIVSDAPADGDRTLHFTASLSDNTTGMQYAYAQFVSPTANQYLGVSFSVPFAGAIITPVTVNGQGTLQRYAETGIWTLQSFSMMDVATNQVNLDNATVAATGFPTTFAVTGVDDLVDPEVVPASSEMLPGTPIPGDAADAALRTFTIETRLTDDLAGVAWISASFTRNGQNVYASFNRTAGDELDGTWLGTAVVPRYAATGTWPLQYLSAGDRVGNQMNLDATQAAAIGFPTTFEVTGAEDLAPPEIVAFDFDPKSFNNVGCKTTVSVAAHVTDDVSGTSYIQANFNGPAGQSHGVSLSLASGTDLDGIWTGSFSLPFESATGTWTLGNAYDADHAGNQRNLGTTDLVAAGFPTTFEVVAGTGEVCVSPDLTLQEGGGTGSTTVNMTTQPAADVDVDLTQAPGAGASPGTQLAFSPTTVHFTPENWNVPQHVTVSALDDGITEVNPHQAIITGATTSADPIFDGQTPTATVTIGEQSPTLAVSATPGSDHGLAGFSTTWSFTLSNTGPGDASNAGLTVTVPTGAPGFAVNGSPTMDGGFGSATSVNVGSTVYTCTRAAALGNGDAATFSLSTTTNGSPGDAPTITAAGAADATPATTASTATVTATIDTPVFDLTVTNQADGSSVVPGSAVEWTTTVTNTSTDGEKATGVVVTYDLPAGLDLAGGPSMSGYSCTPSTGSGPLTIVCSGGPDLPVGDIVTLTVPTTVTASAGVKLVTTSTATADQTDANPGDNSMGAAVNVEDLADVVTTKSVSSAGVASGTTVTWTITATNTSTTTDAGSPQIDDALPGGLVPTNIAAPAGFSCSVSGSDVHCGAPSLAPGATAVLTFDTLISGKSGASFKNVATVVATNDPDSANDQASATVTVDPTATIHGTVTEAGSGTPIPGIQVEVVEAADPSHQVAGSSTGPDGSYTAAGLPVGEYLVHFRDGSNAYGAQWYDRVPDLASAATVSVTNPSDDIGKIDAVLDVAAQISGTVTSEIDGTPLEGICVAAFDPSSTNFDGSSAVSETQTAADGTYTLGGLASTPYLVLFHDCSKKTSVYAPELYDGGTGTIDPDMATPVTPKGRTTDIDAALGLGGSVSGTVYQLPAGTPIEGRCVVALLPGFGVLSVTSTGADGSYVLGGIPAGQIYIAAGTCDSKDDAPEFVWYAGATSVPVSIAEDDADPVGDGAKLVTVVAGATTTGIDLFFGTPAGGSTTPTNPPTTGTGPSDAENASTSDLLSGSLPRTGATVLGLAVLGALLLGAGLLVVRISEFRRAR